MRWSRRKASQFLAHVLLDVDDDAGVFATAEGVAERELQLVNGRK
jgi:hypothetical protein